MKFKIGNRLVGDGQPPYFIAEIGANHEGSLERAKLLCALAKRAGCDAAKFQHFRADTIVSNEGFLALGKQAHQVGWKDSVYNSFKKYETPWEWTPILKEYCDKIGIEFMSTPYDIEAVDILNPYVNAFKIGSGDINYTKLLRYIADRRKPVILSTGASTIGEVATAVYHLMEYDIPICLMQCTTNYSGKHAASNVSVLSKYHRIYKDQMIYGYSDHLEGATATYAAVALGASIIERHFTDNKFRTGSPDHPFATTPTIMESIIRFSREIAQNLGDGEKRVETEEREARVVQRRCLRAACDLPKGATILSEHIVALRPAPEDSLAPTLANATQLSQYGVTKREVKKGEYFCTDNVL